MARALILNKLANLLAYLEPLPFASSTQPWLKRILKNFFVTSCLYSVSCLLLSNSWQTIQVSTVGPLAHPYCADIAISFCMGILTLASHFQNFA